MREFIGCPYLSSAKETCITSFCGHLPSYQWRMTSIVSQSVVVLVNRLLSNGSVS